MPLRRTFRRLLAVLPLTSCPGQGKRQAQRLERLHGMPMRDILATEKPRQILQHQRAAAPIPIAGKQP